MTLRKTFRKWTYLSHLWIGLILCLYFTVLGLTGTSLIFKPEIHRLLYPRLHFVQAEAGQTKLPLDQVAKTFQNYSHAKIASIILPEHSNESIVIGYQPLPDPDGKQGDWRQCYLNPYTGKILGDEVAGGVVFRTLRNLHVNLLLQDVGLKLSAVGVLFVIALLLSGLWLWFPDPRHFVQQFKQRTSVRWRASFGRFNFDLHNTVGFYSSIPLLIFCLTALSALWYDQTVAVVSVVTGTPQNECKFTPDPDQPAAFSYDKVLQTVEAAVPGYSPAIITDSMHVLMAKPDSHLIFPMMVNVGIDKSTGVIKSIEQPELLPTGKQVMNWLMPIHYGQWGFGALYYPARMLWFVAGLCPLILSITGVFTYINKLRAKRVKPPPAPVLPEQPAVLQI